MKVIHQDIAVLKFCNRGARQFFARHGLDWSDFIKNGIDFAVLETIDDEMARQAIGQAKRRLGIVEVTQ